MHGLSSILDAPDYWLTRLLVQRGLGVIYLAAFLNALNQYPALLGDRGLLPASRRLGRAHLRHSPSLFHLRYSDGLLRLAAGVGVAASVAVILGLPELAAAPVSMATWCVLWALYLSIVNSGQTFYAFGWETLLCEAGFLAIFLGPSSTAPSAVMIWLLRWLVLRLELGAGLIKLRGDRCWRDLTCLYYHHETQPMPNPLSWFFHNLPRPLHRLEVAGNHVAQLAAPLALMAPQPAAAYAALLIIATQLWLFASGNFSWLNAITIVLALSGLESAWQLAATIGVALLVAVLSWWPVRNMASRHQNMNASFNALHLVNTYGAFGSITRVRHEVVIEGSDEIALTPGTAWREYEFKGKPGDVRRRPPQVAPYHLRLDWMMWFAALSWRYAEGWLLPLMGRLLAGDARTLRLLGRNPFPDRPPVHVRALLYRYRFTTWEERRRSRAWWARQLVGEYVPPLGRVREQPDQPAPSRRSSPPRRGIQVCAPRQGWTGQGVDSTRRISSRSEASEIGLVSNPRAPAAAARSGSSRESRPVTISTRAPGETASRRRQTSRPSIPGMLMSRRTRSNGDLCTAWSASSALWAGWVRKPCISMKAATVRASRTLSSTIRTVGDRCPPD